MVDSTRTHPLWLIRISRLAGGFALGMTIGLIPSLVLVWGSLERDGASVLLGCCGLAIAVAIALQQWVLAELSRRSANAAHQELMLNVNRENLGSFLEVYEAVSHTTAAAANSLDSGELRLGWPMHDFGNVNIETKDSGAHRELVSDLVRNIESGRRVQLATIPLVDEDREFPLMEVFRSIEEVSSVKLQGTIKSNLSAELKILCRLLNAAETSESYRQRKSSPLNLIWIANPSVFWTFRIGGNDSVEDAILFTSDRDQPSQSDKGVVTSCKGLVLSAVAGAFMREVSAAVEEHGIHLTRSHELRNLRKALERAHKRLDSAHDRPDTVLNELHEAFFVNAKLCHFLVFDQLGGRHHGTYYHWKKPGAKKVVVVIPSAAGLYGDWRSKSGSGEIPKLRFLRYKRICEEIGGKADADVALLSQSGQAGYGVWSPVSSTVELEALIEELSEVYESVTCLGVCTGGLAALEVFLKKLKSPRRKSPIESKLRGIALWDLTKDPGFDETNVALATARYDLTVATRDAFESITCPLETAAKVSDLLVKNNLGRRVWCGGVGTHAQHLPKSAQSWDKIKELIDSFDQSVVEGFKGGSIGHVPGDDTPGQFDLFVDSLIAFLNSIADEKLVLQSLSATTTAP